MDFDVYFDIKSLLCYSLRMQYKSDKYEFFRP